MITAVHPKETKMTFSKYAFLVAPAALVATTPSPAQSSSEQMARVLQHMKAVGTMSATFTQTDRSGGTLTGKLLLKRPGKYGLSIRKTCPY